MDQVRLYIEPTLNNPIMVAAWPGMGGVAIIAARFLKEKLGGQDLGQIDPEEFFDASAVVIEDSVIQEPELPDNSLYVLRGKGERDIIIFIGEAQPPMNDHKLANVILDTAQRFGVERIYTFAATPNHIYHTKTPRVLAATTRPGLVPELKEYDVTLLREGTISGMNGLLLGYARRRDMDGVCLLGEIPIYTTHIANPRSSRAVLSVMRQMTGLDVELTELDEWASETDKEIEHQLDILKSSYQEEARELIQYFELLAEKSSEEEEIQAEYKTEELLKEIEQYLRGRGGKEEGH